MSKKLTAAALGVTLAFLVAGYFWQQDDMTAVLCPATRAVMPYEARFFYPIWCLYPLRALCCMPRWAATLAGVWSVLIVLTCSGKWNTPAWLSLLAPPFLSGLAWGHPFEAVVFLGLTLIARGDVGIGLALLAFKPQLGLIPGLYVAWAHRREWRVFMPLVLLVVSMTCLDLALTGRLWVIPFYHAVGVLRDVSWNASSWQMFLWMSLLWLPIGIWLLLSQWDKRRRLFVAYALGLLIMPYWAAYSMWPLVAMIGCWRFYAVEKL